jgi:hypothetical protein
LKALRAATGTYLEAALILHTGALVNASIQTNKQTPYSTVDSSVLKS